MIVQVTEVRELFVDVTEYWTLTVSPLAQRPHWSSDSTCRRRAATGSAGCWAAGACRGDARRAVVVVACLCLVVLVAVYDGVSRVPKTSIAASSSRRRRHGRGGPPVGRGCPESGRSRTGLTSPRLLVEVSRRVQRLPCRSLPRLDPDEVALGEAVPSAARRARLRYPRQRRSAAGIRAARRPSKEATYAGVVVRVASLDDIVASKEWADRPKDREASLNFTLSSRRGDEEPA